MALDGTYSGLKASVADFLNRGDLALPIPDFITLAEAQMARRFVSRSKQGMSIPRRLISRSDASVSISDEYLTVPSNFTGPLQFALSGSPINELDYIDDADFQREKKLNRWRGAPKYYTVVGGQFQFYPVADQAYTAELTYIGRIPALTDATQAANWVLQDYPDAYLYGALVQSAPYLKDDARITLWGTMFTAAVDDICNSDPMPTSKTKLRTELSRYMLGTRTSAGGYYNISSDT